MLRFVFAFAVLASPVAAQTGGCGEPEFFPENVVGEIAPGDKGADGALIFFEEPCDGAVYIATPDGNPLGRVNESWRLWAFVDAIYADGADRIDVTAEFVTGIGPTGAEPFRVRIPLTQNDGAWAAGEAVVVD